MFDEQASDRCRYTRIVENLDQSQMKRRDRVFVWSWESLIET